MANNWIEDILIECESVETPRSWIVWSLLTAIAASAGNNYKLRSKYHVDYTPNLYVILMGASGLGKGFGINLARKLVQKADTTRAIVGRASIQGIVRELATARSRESGKPPFTDSRGYIVNSELAAGMVQDPAALKILTDLYDSHYQADGWGNVLKEERDKLLAPNVTMLAGSSPSYFYSHIPKESIEGGFLGRTILVEEKDRYKNLPLMFEDEEDSDSIPTFPYDKYAKYLDDLSQCKGEFKSEKGVGKYFNSWRDSFREQQKSREDSTGFLNRAPDHAVKVAMCLCLSRYSNGLVLTRDDIDSAIELVNSVVHTTKHVSEGAGDEPLSKKVKMVLDLLLAAPECTLTRKQLLSRGMGQWTTQELDGIMDYLFEADWVGRDRVNTGSSGRLDFSFKLKDVVRDNYQRLIESRKTKITRVAK